MIKVGKGKMATQYQVLATLTTEPWGHSGYTVHICTVSTSELICTANRYKQK